MTLDFESDENGGPVYELEYARLQFERANLALHDALSVQRFAGRDVAALDPQSKTRLLAQNVAEKFGHFVILTFEYDDPESAVEEIALEWEKDSDERAELLNQLSGSSEIPALDQLEIVEKIVEMIDLLGLHESDDITVGKQIAELYEGYLLADLQDYRTAIGDELTAVLLPLGLYTVKASNQRLEGLARDFNTLALRSLGIEPTEIEHVMNDQPRAN